jgi:geranylgeranyl pyrophosphate synthase
MFSEIINAFFSKRSTFADDLLLVKDVFDDFIKEIELNSLVKRININGGKLLRSIMYFGAFYLNNSKNTNDLINVHKTAALIEAAHFASLLHDDVVDNSMVRRNTESSLKINGSKVSILVGDYIATKVVNELFKIHEDKLIANMFLEKCSEMARGALLEQILTVDSDIDDYVTAASLKTSSLFECSASIGARLASIDDHLSSKISKFGRCFGLIYQVQNDINCYRFKNFFESEDYMEKNATFPSIVMKRFFDYDVFSSKTRTEKAYKIAQEIVNSRKFMAMSMDLLNDYYKYLSNNLKLLD